MASTNLYDVRGILSDAQDTEKFDFIIPGIPGGIAGDGRAMAIACQQAVYPGRSNEIMEAPIHGTQVNFAGRAIMPRTLNIVYIETHELMVTNIMQNWFEYQTGTISGVASGYKSQYSVDGAVVYKYDVTGRIADTAVFYGLQPEEMPDVTLDGSSTNLWTVNLTFRYDFYLPRNVRFR